MSKEQLQEALEQIVKELGYESFDGTWGGEGLVGVNGYLTFSADSLRMFQLLVKERAKALAAAAPVAPESPQKLSREALGRLIDDLRKDDEWPPKDIAPALSTCHCANLPEGLCSACADMLRKQMERWKDMYHEAMKAEPAPQEPQSDYRNLFINAAKLNHETAHSRLSSFEECGWSTCQDARSAIAAQQQAAPSEEKGK